MSTISANQQFFLSNIKYFLFFLCALALLLLALALLVKLALIAAIFALSYFGLSVIELIGYICILFACAGLFLTSLLKTPIVNTIGDPYEIILMCVVAAVPAVIVLSFPAIFGGIYLVGQVWIDHIKASYIVFYQAEIEDEIKNFDCYDKLNNNNLDNFTRSVELLTKMTTTCDSLSSLTDINTRLQYQSQILLLVARVYKQFPSCFAGLSVAIKEQENLSFLVDESINTSVAYITADITADIADITAVISDSNLADHDKQKTLDQIKSKIHNRMDHMKYLIEFKNNNGYIPPLQTRPSMK